MAGGMPHLFQWAIFAIGMVISGLAYTRATGGQDAAGAGRNGIGPVASWAGAGIWRGRRLPALPPDAVLRMALREARPFLSLKWAVAQLANEGLAQHRVSIQVLWIRLQQLQDTQSAARHGRGAANMSGLRWRRERENQKQNGRMILGVQSYVGRRRTNGLAVLRTNGAWGSCDESDRQSSSRS
jgi:hypothetical protein